MKQKTQIPHAESQILSQRGVARLPLLRCGLCIATSFLRAWETEENSNCTVEKPDKHHPSQVTKVSMANEKSF